MDAPKISLLTCGADSMREAVEDDGDESAAPDGDPSVDDGEMTAAWSFRIRWIAS